MSVLLDLLNGDVPRAIGLALINLLWQGALVAALVAVALRLMHRSSAAARYAVVAGGLAMMLVLPVATGLYLFTSGTPAATEAWQPPAEVAALLTSHEATVPPGPHRPATARIVDHVRAGAEHALPWLLAAWLLGVLLLSGRLAAGALGARRLCREASPPSGEWHQRFDPLRRRMRIARPVRLLESAGIDVPMVVGWFRPVVLVPITALTGLSAHQVELILSHELAHIRRHDHLVNLLQTMAETVLFYHPATWWLSKQVRIERENCCDDLVVELCGSALPYARALLELESLRVSHRRVALAANGGSLHERILRLVHPESACSERWISGAPLFGIVALLVVAAPLAVSAQLGTDAPFKDPVIEVFTPHGEGVLPGDVPPTFSPPVPPSVPPMTSGGERDNLDIDDLIAMRIHRVTPEFVRGLEALGYRDLGPRQLVQMRIHRVTPEFIREMRAAGFGELSWRELITMRIHRVTPEFIRELGELGFKDLSHRQLVTMRIHRITPELIREVRGAGFGDLEPDQLVRLRISGVDRELIDGQRRAPTSGGQ